MNIRYKFFSLVSIGIELRALHLTNNVTSWLLPRFFWREFCDMSHVEIQECIAASITGNFMKILMYYFTHTRQK